MRPLFLIGFMACGKTTLGTAVAARTGCSYADLDDTIERDCGMSVSEIFATEGEAAFRRRETIMLRRLVATGVAIISCGGGTPCRRDNIEFMLATGTVVWLVAPIERLVERILLGGDSRPLAVGKSREQLISFVEQTLAERTSYYERANARFDSSHLEDAEQIDTSARAFIAQFMTNEPQNGLQPQS